MVLDRLKLKQPLDSKRGTLMGICPFNVVLFFLSVNVDKVSNTSLEEKPPINIGT